MANGAVLGCCDDIMRQLRNPDLPFGGAPLVLLGDWRQTCPVVRRGTRAQVVAASIKMSPLWQHFTTYHLITPIRNAEDLDYADFVDTIGDGAGPEIDLEPFLPITTEPDELIDFVYHSQSFRILRPVSHGASLRRRTFKLTPTTPSCSIVWKEGSVPFWLPIL